MRGKKFLSEGMNDWNLLNKTLMGPNCLKLLHEAVADFELQEGAVVLDLGCGAGLTSMYLAETFGVTVFATDLWIDATDNLERFRRFGLEDCVYPIHAEAHELPYARGFFDAVVSVDSYHYYGIEEGYLEKHLAPLLKPGAPLLVAVPGLQREFENGTPEVLAPYLPDDANFHSCDWWRGLWERSGVVEEISCTEMAVHAEAWADWLRCDNEHAQHDGPMMAAEGGRYFNTIRIAARAR